MTTSRRQFLLGAGAVGGTGLLALSGCGDDAPATGVSTQAAASGPLSISAIPDQDPELLNRLYPALAERFAEAAGLEVTYRPLTDYTAVVRAFEVGDIHVSWMGGLTGVQARSRVPGAVAIAQRDIDAAFHSVFIASTASGCSRSTRSTDCASWQATP